LQLTSPEDAIGNRSSQEVEAQKAHEAASYHHGEAFQNHMNAFDQYEKHHGETRDKGLQSKIMDASRYHLAKAEKHEGREEHHTYMASQHESCTGTSCSIIPPDASTAAARKSAESAEFSSFNTKTELGFLKLATHYEDQSAADSKNQKKAERLRKSAVHHRSMPSFAKRMARHQLAKHYRKVGKNLT
jgi:hypothetical protein